MFRFSQPSLARLATCRADLADVAHYAIALSPVDFGIIHGWRDEAEQNAFFRSGASTKRWPDSKHNATQAGKPESLAFDFAPWVDGRTPWEDTHLFALIAGVLFAAAADLGVAIRWGGDWDCDGLTTDQTLMDYGHIEIR